MHFKAYRLSEPDACGHDRFTGVELVWWHGNLAQRYFINRAAFKCVQGSKFRLILHQARMLKRVFHKSLKQHEEKMRQLVVK